MPDIDRSPYCILSDIDKFLSAFDKRLSACRVYFCSKR